jgi:hypothetical protein
MDAYLDEVLMDRETCDARWARRVVAKALVEDFRRGVRAMLACGRFGAVSSWTARIQQDPAQGRGHPDALHGE